MEIDTARRDMDVSLPERSNGTLWRPMNGIKIYFFWKLNREAEYLLATEPLKIRTDLRPIQKHIGLLFI
jgi:hypothetical protein